MSPPTLLFFFKMVLVILDPLTLCMSFRISLSIASEKAVETLTGIVLNISIYLGSTVIFTILMLPNYDRGVSF